MISMDNANSVRGLKLSDVEETGLLTLYCRAVESESPDPILRDEKALELVHKIDPLLVDTGRPLLKRLYTRKIDKQLVVYVALRAVHYDHCAKSFIANHPEGIIVNIGCGMDTRFFRIDDGKLPFFDLDLPQIITAKKKLLSETERYHMIGKSVFDYTWMDQVAALGVRPVMFLAEGVFMYLPEDQVRALVLELQKRFPGSELVCEVVNKRWIQGFFGKITAVKMNRRMNIGKQAGFLFGLTDSRELESWHSGIQYVDEWSYFESNHEKLGTLRMVANWPLFRKAQYTVHYRLN